LHRDTKSTPAQGQSALPEGSQRQRLGLKSKAIYNSRIAAAILFAGLSSSALSSTALSACVGPAQLEAALKAHPDAKTYGELGNWFGEQHRFDCGAEAFKSALLLEPNSASWNYMLGLSLYSEGHPEEAVPPLQQSTQLAPTLLKAHLLLAGAYELLNDRQNAATEWEAALKLDPKSPLALHGLSKSLIAAGDYSAVVDHLKSVPRDEDLDLDLALAYGRMGMNDQAGATLEAALRQKPTSVRLTTALVTVRVQQTRYQDASILAEKIARLHPGDLDAQVLYLRVLVLNGDTAIARPLARKLLVVSPHNFDALYLSGILERQAGEYAIARTHLEEAVTIDPNYNNAHYNLGAVLAKLQDPKGAREEFEKAISLGATEPEVRFDLAGVLRTLGETQLAQEQLKLYQQEVKDKANRTLAAGKEAQAQQAMTAGDAQKAAGLYREAFDAMPGNAMLGYQLALAQDKAGDIAGERTTLEQVVSLDPSMALAQSQLGYVDSRAGDAAAAEQHFRLALQAAPGYTHAWISLAATLGMESRFPEAQQALATALKLDPDNTEARGLAKALTAAANQAQQ
jgi:tetratricopeptide (TPR) repeat protein